MTILRSSADIQRGMRHRAMWKGMVAGAAGGLAGAGAMNQAHAAIAKLKKQRQQTENPAEESEDATMKAADKVLSIAAGRHLTHEQKKMAGPVVHYAFGAVMGALYGAVTEHRQHLSPVAGPVFRSEERRVGKECRSRWS